ncbi:MAG: hypothetical protein IKL65_00580 [Bacilli bacterium]|nr:hypothetical protein [Bacilli bacterium]MBR6689812.1 hypothetical protein [Bacilli bacterium]
MEKFMYVSPYMRITQGYLMGSHVGSYAIDDGGSDSGKDYIIAPYSGTVKQIYPQYENEVFYESDNPVEFADGTVDYATTMFLHQDSPMAYDMHVGKHYNQGEKIYIEGGRYKGKNGVFATHLHVEFARGKYQDWYKNSCGYYSLPNAKKPEDCCFIDDTYHILYNYGYNFKNVKDCEYKLGNYKTLYNMNVRRGASIDSGIKKVKELTEDGKRNATSYIPDDNAVYKKGTIFTAKVISKQGNYVWAKSPSGYICLKDNKMEYCKKL